MESEHGTGSKAARSDIAAAACKAREWLSHGNPEELSAWSRRTFQNSTSTPGSGTFLPVRSQDANEETEIPDDHTVSSHRRAPSIIPKEVGRKVESPKDDNAPLPKPLSTIEGAVPGSEIKKRTRAASTATIRSLVSWGNNSEKLELVLRDQGQISRNDWGDAHADIIPQQDYDVMCVSAWIDDVAEAPGVDMSLVKYQDPDTRDIDTFTGDFAEHYDYPHTMKNPEEVEALEDGKATWRRDNMTATLHMKHKEAAAEMRKMEVQQIEAFTEARPVAQPEPVEWPAANCLLRPVRKDDYEAISEINNLEAHDEHCPQVIEERLVKAGHIEDIHGQCNRAHYPFIIAVSNKCSLFNRSKWPKNSEKEYQEYVKFKKSQPPDGETVLGFVYISAPRTGISGKPCYGSRHSGEIKLLVHRDHRRNLVGTALLDRILMSVDIYHRSLVDHEWQCSDHKGVYEKPAANNHRQYTWVDIVTFCPKGDEKALERQERFVDKYGFEMRSRLEEEVKLDRRHESAWLDVVCWRLIVRERTEMANRVQSLRSRA